MKQVLQNRSGITVVRDVPPPPCPPGGVLVRSAFSAISSGTERARVELSRKSLVEKALARPDLVRTIVSRAQEQGLSSTVAAVRRQLETEIPVGYSCAGTVIEVGARVAGLSVGDHVACCGAGHANHAEIVSMPRNLVAKVPIGVPLEAAAMSAIASVALHGIRVGGVELGHRVAVIGCGLIGQIACRLLVAGGATVYAIDIDPARVRRALDAGATFGTQADVRAAVAVRDATHQKGVDVVLVTAASEDAAPSILAAEIARDRGTVVIVGASPIELPRGPLYEKELSLRVSRSYGPGRYDAEYEERGLDYPFAYVRWTEQRNMECVLDLMAKGRLSLVDLIDEVVPVDEAQRAYDRLVSDPKGRPNGTLILSYPVREPSRSRASQPTMNPQAQPLGIDAPRIGLIGAGSFATRVLVPAFANAGGRLSVVAGGAGPSAEQATRRLGFDRWADTEDDLLNDPEVDVVVITTRHASHADLTLRALRGQKHVFCEKPLALTASDLEDVLDTAAQAKGVLCVGFNRRFAPMLRDLREFMATSTGPTVAVYRVSAGRIDPTHWVHDPDQGGGRALGEVCHFIDALRFVVGSDIVRVSAFGHGSDQLPIQSSDNLVINLLFRDGSVGTITYVADGSPRLPKERLEVFRGDRSAILDDYRDIELLTHSDRRTARGRQDKGHRDEVRQFIQGVRTGIPPIPLVEVANVSRATIAVVESLRTGSPALIA